MMARINYTTINHEARVRLGLTINEYCVYDLIHNLASNPKNIQMGWCYAKKETIAEYLDLSRATVFRAIKKGLKINLLEKHPEQPAFLKATSDWYDSVMIKAESQNETASINMRREASQSETKPHLKMRLNKDIENNENDNTEIVNLKNHSKGIVSIGQVIANHQPSLLGVENEWEVEAIRLWHELNLSGDPSESFVKHIHRYIKKNLQVKLSVALSFCKDATKVRDREKLFYWRCANEPA
jgi:hypothetical protein